MNTNQKSQNDYSRENGSFFSQTLARLRSPFLSVYAFVRKSFFFRALLNSSGIKLYQKNIPILNELQKKIVNDLMKNGIAISNLNNIFPEREMINKLLEAAENCTEKPHLSQSKPFLRYSLGRGSMIDLSNPLNQLSLEPRILEIINSYLGICTKLRYFELTTSNLIDKNDVSIGSQRWHRDPTLYGLCKMFVYLSDVDENSGPFTYIVQSHSKGKLNKVFPQRQFGRHGFYPPDGAVEKKIPQRNILPCIGKKGTVIFCDTTGLHKGGFSFSKERTMYSSTYVFGGDIIKRVFKFPPDFDKQLNKLDTISRFSLTDD